MCTETEPQAKTETVFCTTVAFKRKKTVLKQIAGLISPLSTVIIQVTETRQVSQLLKTDRSVCLLQKNVSKAKREREENKHLDI